MSNNDYNKYKDVLKKYDNIKSSLGEFFKDKNPMQDMHKNIFYATDAVTGLDYIVEFSSSLAKIYSLH